MNNIRTYWKRWVIGGVAAVLLLAVGGPYVYINYVTEPAPETLSLDNTTQQERTSDGRAGVEGKWKVSDGSQAGYRVDEVLFGQNVTAVGRTEKVTGELAVEGTKATSAAFTVDLASVKSDSDRRDGQFRDRIVNTATYPEAKFELTAPVDFKKVPAVGEKVTAKATGTFSIHGKTKSVTFDLTAQRTDAAFRVNGSVPVVFADYGIADPGFSGIEVEDQGTIEFLLDFTAA